MGIGRRPVYGKQIAGAVDSNRPDPDMGCIDFGSGKQTYGSPKEFDSRSGARSFSDRRTHAHHRNLMLTRQDHFANIIPVLHHDGSSVRDHA